MEKIILRQRLVLFCFIIWGISSFCINYFVYFNKELSISSYRRIRSQEEKLLSLSIPEYLERYPQVKKAFLDKLRVKNIPQEYITIAEELRILEWYKDYFEGRLFLFLTFPEEIADKLAELFIYDAAVSLTYQSEVKEEPKCILDLGSGEAKYFRAFAHLFQEFEAILGIETEDWAIKEAKKIITFFDLDRLGKYINVVKSNMFDLENTSDVSRYKPYDLVTLLHPNIFAPMETLKIDYVRLIAVKKLFHQIYKELLKEGGKIVITIDKTYVPEETSLSFIQERWSPFLNNYLHYVAYVYALRFANFAEEIAPAILTYPSDRNPLEKSDRKFVGTKENIANFIRILEKVEKVTIEFSVNIAFDLFRLTFGERFVGIEILARPELEGKLWEVLSVYEKGGINREELAQQIKTLLGSPD